MYNEREVSRLGSDLVISIYLDSKIGRRFDIIRCIYCGHPIIETTNAVRQIVDNPGENINIKIGIIIQCKRCKQRYRAVVHEDYI